MPVVLLLAYLFLWYKFGLVSALEITAMAGTLWAITGGILRLRSVAKRDENGQYHDSENGQFVSPRSAYYGYVTAIGAVVFPILTKPDLLTTLTPTLFTNLPTEFQGVYVLVAHVIGYGLTY